MQAVKHHFDPFAKRDNFRKLVFQNGEIDLDIPKDGDLTQEGWKVTPICYPAVVSSY